MGDTPTLPVNSFPGSESDAVGREISDPPCFRLADGEFLLVNGKQGSFSVLTLPSEPFMRNLLTVAVIAFGALAVIPGVGFGQERTGRYYPLDHRKPLGEVGRWSVVARPSVAGYVQPVQIRLPSEGDVSFFRGGASSAVTVSSPAQAGMQVGYAYRLKISNLPDHPGVEIFPTVELLGRLHPPAELKDKYPIPVEISDEEIEAVINDQMVTKVIYLEQPQLANPTRQVNGKMHVEALDTEVNLLEAADMRGRPIAILRMGGRIPDPLSPDDEFYSLSPITLPGD